MNTELNETGINDNVPELAYNDQYAYLTSSRHILTLVIKDTKGIIVARKKIIKTKHGSYIFN